MSQRLQESATPQTPRLGRSRWRRTIFISLAILGLCVAARYYRGSTAAVADPTQDSYSRKPRSAANASRSTTEAAQAHESSTNHRQPRAKAGPEPSAQAGREESNVPDVVATVNNQRITRDDLARECLRHYGNEVLESVVNKHLIVEECRRRGIVVSRAEVDGEIERTAKRFALPVDQYLKLLQQDRNITPSQYANEIVWPKLALQKLAGERISISRQELKKEYETQFGERVSARLIAVSDAELAEKLRAKAVANPEDFGNLAKRYSEDTASASMKGFIQPIRKHGSYKEIETALFNMADGDVSPVIRAGNQYVFLKRERLIEAQRVSFEEAAPQLEESLRERKARAAAQDIFRQLQDDVKDKIDMVWSDPKKRARMPGVAAVVDGRQITVRQLAEECIARHGTQTLEGVITRKLLEQACRKQGIAVTDADLDEEIARAALAGMKSKPDGSPDVAAWLEFVTKKQGIPVDIYRNDAVWPSVALKKLVGEKVAITEEDLHKGFEANFGPKVRCLAIVLNNQRRAQQVFEMARKNNTTENFGDLAAQYSIEPGSQANRGEVPPIRKHGGQPKLEEEAFSLKPGELSGIVQVGDKFIILRCEEYTKPLAEAKFELVRDEIYRDLHEKKLRLTMAERFEELQEAATIDNYLTGSSRSPKASDSARPSKVPMMRQIPAG